MRDLRSLTGEVTERLAERVPPRLLGLRGGHVAIIAGGLIVAIVAAALLVVRSRPVAEALPEVSRRATVVAAASTTPANGATPSPPAAVVVHVVGKVREPGVVQVPAGSRVIDAIDAAGGAEPGIDLRKVNLAQVLVDGDQVLVGISPEEGAPQVAGAVVGNPGVDGSPSEPIDLNTATLDQLDTLPGVGPVLAQRILDYRAEHGRFTAVDELLDVSGIGESRFADLEPRVAVS